jgi:PD-(D/E)XK nuclease superfamily
MPVTSRSTLIVHGRLAMRAGRLAAARDARHGLQIMTFEQAAVRLAGGFAQAIDSETLRGTIQAVLPTTDMGELERIKMLPGMITAAVDSLRKVWHAGIDLASRTPQHLRLDAMARLEAAVLARLPQGMLRPSDIVAAATARLGHSPAVMGTIEISGLTELEPCWRPLLKALATLAPVQWTAGPRAVPDWLKDSAVKVVTATAESPTIGVVSAATAYHEAIEALRWARALLAAGVTASDIAVASASPAEYDDAFLALRADANLDLHFVHGVRTITTRDGQAAAALADLVVRGLARARLRRLAVLCKEAKPFEALPEGWLRILPPDAPLANLPAWEQLLARLEPKDWPDQKDHSAALRDAVRLLAKGAAAAAELGEAFLEGRALAIWRKALLAGPAVAIDATLASLKQDDGLEACVSVAWMPASALAASPRPFVRLVGLNSSRWPRGISEDRLVPDHIIATAEIDPLPVNLADRRDFQTILATTAKEVVLSRARRDSEGRLLGRSPLLDGHDNDVYLRRHAIPLHAFSETDRLMARPAEFALEPQAASATSCWRNWRRPEITAHDGLVRADHPLLLQILHRKHSASSLKFLLRNPLGYVWRYAFHWEAPESSTEPLVLDALDFGDLVHRTLDLALQELESAGGVSLADVAAITSAVQNATERVVVDWESKRAVPPGVIWRKTLEEVRETSGKALSFRNDALPNSRAYSEVPFGGLEPKSGSAAPWDTTAPVVIPGTDFQIGGYIDRLDVAADGSQALVRDYKTGNPPKKPIRLNGGSELQRCLYAFAVKALLGERVAISASLLYPHADLELQLDNPDAAMADITTYLRAAETNFAAGAAIPGPDTASDYDDLAFALPANAGATYCKRKLPAVLARLADLAPLWEAE